MNRLSGRQLLAETKGFIRPAAEAEYGRIDPWAGEGPPFSHIRLRVDEGTPTHEASHSALTS